MAVMHFSWKSMALCLCFLLFFSFGLFWPYIYNELLTENLVIKPGSKSYNNWIRTPLPMYLDIYLFNVTNSKEFLNKTNQKLKIKEVGPFIFREVHERVNVTFNDDGTVSYNQTRSWVFVPEGSVPLNVNITNLDAIALGAAHATRYSSTLLQDMLDLILRVLSKVFVTRPAEEWLFKGMNLSLLNILNSRPVKKYLPIDIPFDKFGFFYNRNMSAAYDGHFVVFTGENGLTETGNMVSWNGRNQTSFFEGSCAIVNGSAGEIFPQNYDDETFTLFISDVCSSLQLKYDSFSTVEHITGRRYIGDESMFDNGQNLPERKCFCIGECVPQGARNMTTCRQGAPVFVSYPHFYLADPSYLANVDGLSPNESLHEFQLILEPRTGIPLDVKARLQVNLLLQPYKMYKMYKNMPRVFVPMLWFNQRAHITGELVSETSLLITLSSLYVIGYTLAALIAFIWIAKCFIPSRICKREEDEEVLINNEVENE